MAGIQNTTTFLTLPQEVRDAIYEFAASPTKVARPEHPTQEYNAPKAPYVLPAVCRQIQAEISDRPMVFAWLHAGADASFWDTVYECSDIDSNIKSGPYRMEHNFVVPTPANPEYSALYCRIDMYAEVLDGGRGNLHHEFRSIRIYSLDRTTGVLSRPTTLSPDKDICSTWEKQSTVAEVLEYMLASYNSIAGLLHPVDRRVADLECDGLEMVAYALADEVKVEAPGGEVSLVDMDDW